MDSKVNLYCVTPYYPPNLGGMQNCAKIISEYFANKGNKVTVLTSNIGCDTSLNIEKKENMEIKYLKSIEFAHTPFSLSLFSELLKIPKCSIVHLHVANAFFPELVYLASRIKKFKYIVHLHIDVEASGPFGFILPLYKRLVLKKVLIGAVRVICLSDSFKKIVNTKYRVSNNNILVIKNGVASQFFIERKKIKRGNLNLLYVGRLSPQKNLPLLIRSMSNVKIPVKLHIVGDGEQKVYIENLIKAFELNNIVLHGIKLGSELLSYYKSADIFVLPSTNEGMSLAILEAMAAGLPIVCQNIFQLRDVVKGAIFVNSSSTVNFSRAINKLGKDYKLREKMGMVNQSIAKEYSWNYSLEIIDKLYKEIQL